jgi:prophage tail gpP-like protein
VLGSSPAGQLLLIGQNTPQSGDILSLPGNIEKINVTISNETVFANYYGTGQMAGSDSYNGAAAAQQFAGPVPGADALQSNLVIVAELAAMPTDVQKRVLFEAQIHNATEVRITVEVQGWLQSNGQLWQAGAAYTVDAPDHLPPPWNGGQYSAQTVTFIQNEDEGTFTRLDLVLPWLLNGNLFQPNLPAGPGAFGAVGFSNSIPAGTP